MIPELVKKEILRIIKAAEQEHNVRVLYAVESGSRAWGFASPNSDYDVRFIYCHPKDWYLSVNLEDKRDVIEYDIVDEIDINGWDVRKALKLFAKSNPTIIEWLHSPITYIDDGVFASSVRDLITSCYSIEKGIYHYRSMAKTNYRGYLQAQSVPLKKYFYVLRPLLSIMWLEQKKLPAPIEFKKLLGLIENNTVLMAEINQLVLRKQNSLEKQMGEVIPILNTFIETELDRLENTVWPKSERSSVMDELNALFKKIVNQSFSN